jgi:hypothetical protein
VCCQATKHTHLYTHTHTHTHTHVVNDQGARTGGGSDHPGRTGMPSVDTQLAATPARRSSPSLQLRDALSKTDVEDVRAVLPRAGAVLVSVVVDVGLAGPLAGVTETAPPRACTFARAASVARRKGLTLARDTKESPDPVSSGIGKAGIAKLLL